MKELSYDARRQKAAILAWKESGDYDRGVDAHQWYGKIKRTTLQAFYNHVVVGVPPGSFLYAVLSNNLREAFACADEENRASLFEIVSYCHNRLPGNCWGSDHDVKEWLKNHGEIARQQESSPLDEETTEPTDG